MSTNELIKKLDKKTIAAMQTYTEEAKKALDKNKLDDVAYWRGHIYAYIDCLVDCGKIAKEDSRKLRIHYGSLAR